MRLKSLLPALLATSALCLTSVLGLAGPALATADCGSATVDANQNCAVQWLTEFDPYPASAEGSTGTAVAVSGDGSRAVWAYAVTSLGVSYLEIKTGTFTATGIAWNQGPLINMGQGQESIQSDMSIALSANGQAGGVEWVTSNAGTSHVHMLPFTFRSTGQFSALEGISQAYISDDIADSDYTIVNPKVSMARDGSKVLFTFGKRSTSTANDGNEYNGTGDFLEYNFANGFHDDLVETNWLSTDAGLSADGSTVWSVGVSTLWTGFPLVVESSCKTTLSSSCLAANQWRLAIATGFLDARGAIDDKGKELAVSYLLSDYFQPGYGYVTTVPLTGLNPINGMALTLPVNIHPYVGDFASWLTAAPSVSLNPAGNMVYVGGEAIFNGLVVSSAHVSGLTSSWSSASPSQSAGVTIENAVEMLVGRNGALLETAFTTNNTLVSLIGNAAYGHEAWDDGTTMQDVASSDAMTASHVAMSDDGQFYLVAVDVQDGHPEVIAGKTLKHNLVVSAPKVTGTYKVGKILSVTPGTWTRSRAGASANTYQWLRDGASISHASGSTYRLVAADRGHSITVSITHTFAGYYNRYLTCGAATIVR